MDKRFLVVLAVCAALLGGVFIFTRDNNSSSGGAINNQAKLSNHIYGQGKTGVKLTEYGDFQCPFCGTYYPVVKEVKEKYKEDIFFQFRHFPLSQSHPNARAAARAAEAASKQNKFWEMHDKLYENQVAWSNTSSPVTIFDAYATDIGLNLQQFKADFASSEVNDIINADFAEGQRIGVNGTPTFFIDGKKIEDISANVEQFSKAIDKAIQAKTTSSQN